MKHVIALIAASLGFTLSAVVMFFGNPFCIITTLVCWYFIESSLENLNSKRERERK